MKNNLPEDFAALECFVSEWVLPDSHARSTKRFSTPYEDTKTFYDNMLGYAEMALKLLRQRQLGELSTQEENLLKLMLALAEVRSVVEWYGEAAANDAFDPSRFPSANKIPIPHLRLRRYERVSCRIQSYAAIPGTGHRTSPD